MHPACYELLIFNLNCRHMVMTEEAFDFSEETLVSYALGELDDTTHDVVRNTLDKNSQLYIRYGNLCHYMECHDLKSLEEFRAYVKSQEEQAAAQGYDLAQEQVDDQEKIRNFYEYHTICAAIMLVDRFNLA